MVHLWTTAGYSRVTACLPTWHPSIPARNTLLSLGLHVADPAHDAGSCLGLAWSTSAGVWFTFKSFMVSDVLSVSLWTQMITSAAANHSPQMMVCTDSAVKHTTAGGSLPLGGGSDCVVTRGTAGLTSHTLLHPTRLRELTLSLPIGRGIAVVEILPSVKHWFPIPKDLCFKVLNHMFHYFLKQDRI